MVELSQILLLLLPIIIPLVYSFLKPQIFHTKKEKKTLPPGKTGWSVASETFDYIFSINQGVLSKFVTERKNKYSSNVFKTSLFGCPTAVLSDAEGNKFLFSNENKLVKHWMPTTFDKIFPKSDNRPTAEHSKTLRKVLAPVIKGDKFRGSVGAMDDVMRRHLGTFSRRDEVKVSEMSKSFVISVACDTFLGAHESKNSADEIAEAIDVISAGILSIPFDFPGTALRRAIRTSGMIRRDLEEMIGRRKRDNPQADSPEFICRFLRTKNDDGELLEDADIASFLLGTLTGAYTSLHSTITNMMMYLAELPSVYDLVLSEQRAVSKQKQPNERLNWEDLRNMKYTWAVACEVMRLHPILGGFKEAITDFEYEGYTIPKGWKIHWIADSLHKNPKYFPDPEKFDPSRFEGNGPSSYTYLPFGAGAHMCPGNEYARVAILIFFHNMVTRFRWIKRDPREKFLQLPYPRPAQGLPVYLHPHQD